MKGNLISILKILSKEEIKKMGKFVRSPYFNSNARVTELYSLLIKFYPYFDALELSRENLYREIYGKDKYVEGTIKYLFSELETLSEKFICLERMNPITYNLSLLETLLHTGQENLFLQKSKVIDKLLMGSSDPQNLHHFKHAYLKRYFKIEQKEFLTKKDTFKKEWTEPAKELIKLFLKNSMWEILLLSNLRTYRNEKLEIPLLNEILSYIESGKSIEDDPEIKILYFQIKLNIENKEKYYEILKDLLVKNSKKIPVDQADNIISNLNNFHSLNIVKGRSFIDEQFNLINLFLKLVIDKTSSDIPIDYFFEAIVVSFATGNFHWAEEFLKKYLKRLPEKYRNNTYHYAYARIYYENKEFDKALKEISQIKNYSFLSFKPAVKILQMMIYFDLKLINEAEDIMNTFIQFLRNDRLINKEIKKYYSNFNNVFSKLIKTEFRESKSKIDDFKIKIENKKDSLLGYNWFKKKSEEMEYKISGSKTIKAV